jgi:hypothetical protein
MLLTIFYCDGIFGCYNTIPCPPPPSFLRLLPIVVILRRLGGFDWQRSLVNEEVGTGSGCWRLVPSLAVIFFMPSAHAGFILLPISHVPISIWFLNHDPVPYSLGTLDLGGGEAVLVGDGVTWRHRSMEVPLLPCVHKSEELVRLWVNKVGPHNSLSPVSWSIVRLI